MSASTRDSPVGGCAKTARAATIFIHSGAPPSALVGCLRPIAEPRLFARPYIFRLSVPIAGAASKAKGWICDCVGGGLDFVSHGEMIYGMIRVQRLTIYGFSFPSPSL